MCQNCYEKYCERSKKVMLFCGLKDNDSSYTSEIEKLCSCQRFCSEEDKYIPHNQKLACKYYK